RALSAPALGRAGETRRRRPRRGARSGADHRRRTDGRPRRVGAGRGAEPAQRFARPHGPVAVDHHPQSARRPADRRPHGGDVSRPLRRGGRDRGRLHRAAPSLYGGAAVGQSRAGSRQGAQPHRAAGRGSVPVRATFGLRVPHPLPLRPRSLRDGGSGTGRCRGQPPHLPFSARCGLRPQFIADFGRAFPMDDIHVIIDFPRRVREIENLWIPMPDGVRLAARIWLPEDAEADPVPAVLEYLPYRKRDGTVERDALTHPYFAGHGYAGVRVDMRGTGDSEGVCEGEYLKQEQDDAVAVIEWLSKQSWCSGTVGMIGISWGGFNGLQVAARRPPALKAVITLCSTDDRYADDVHYLGGAQMIDNIHWGTTAWAISMTPPDPVLVGDKWR